MPPKPYKQSDATYKLTKEGHTILMMGTTTWDQRFILTATMISVGEKDVDFMLLEATIRGLLKQLAPRRSADGALSHVIPFMIADAAMAIKNGERAVNRGEHDEEKLLTCFPENNFLAWS